MTLEFSEKINEGKKIVEENRVKKYLIDEKTVRWVVVGNEREYLVMISPLWCSCYDFQHSVLTKRNLQCKHTLAVQIALQNKQFDTFMITKEEYDYIRTDFLIKD